MVPHYLLIITNLDIVVKYNSIKTLFASGLHIAITYGKQQYFVTVHYGRLKNVT